MEFVNINGDKITIGSTSSKDKIKKPKSDTGPTHKGWLVVGHSPAQVEEYKKALPAGEEFDILLFARRTKYLKVRSKPYETNDAAQVCANMAAKEGWLNVQVQPVVKGVK